MNALKRHTKKILIGILGGLVVLIGFVLIPYPGPGWLIVFAGFAILSMEFEFARTALEYLKKKYQAWSDWLKVQPWYVQLAVLAGTGLTVLVTVYLANGLGIMNSFLNLGQDWLISPFFQ